jgi:hypothetical protein
MTSKKHKGQLKYKPVTIYISPEDHREMQRLAAETEERTGHSTSMTDLARQFIKEGLRRINDERLKK